MSHKILLLAIHHLVIVSISISASPVSLLPGRPFVSVWNAPTSQCWEKYGVDLDLDPFDIVVNQNQTFAGSKMVIFYRNQLGLYPYYNEADNPINGGLPQNTSLRDHLNVAYKNLNTTIPSSDFKGVAVIDWEDWRPLWDRNWDKKDIYREHSQELMQQQHPEWPTEKVLLEAKKEFEEVAEKFITSTLALSRKLRPGGLWGLYGFPGCYNYDYKKGSHNYTGECPAVEVARNNLLKWMWRSSQALYPDIYLEQMLKGSEYVSQFVKHRLEEAFRVSGESVEGGLPVFPYARIVYTYSMDFLTQDDLIQTIGQSAALGTAGVILWGNNDYSCSKEACMEVKSYIDTTLGRYIVNVTSAAALCSQALCMGNGRCVRKDSSFNCHLHLHPNSFSIMKNPRGRGFLISGEASKIDMLSFSQDNVFLIPLHQRPDLIASCAELLNSTWRRSLGARVHSLERSSDEFPVCLVLIGAQEGPVLGHSRLCRVIGLPDSLFVESVVVSTDLRGKGYGRRLMEATERYARGRGFKNLYLTTHDKQDFYYHLGYRLTEPVQNMGTLGSLLPPGMFQNMSHYKTMTTSNHHGGSSSSQETPENKEHGPSLPKFVDINSLHTLSKTSEFLSVSVPVPPPPSCPTSFPLAPPPPTPPFFASMSLSSGLSPPYKSGLSFSPPPPPPCPKFTPSAPAVPSNPILPSPPSAPSLLASTTSSFPQSSLQNRTGSTLQTPYQDIRGDPIFWMMKRI